MSSGPSLTQPLWPAFENMAIMSKPTIEVRPITNPMVFLPNGPPLAHTNSQPFNIILLLVSYIINFLVVQFLGSGVTLRELKKLPRGATGGIAQGDLLVPIQDPVPPNTYGLQLIFRTLFLVVISLSILSLAPSITRVLLTSGMTAKSAASILSSSQPKQGAGVPLSGVGACVLTPATVNLFYNVFLPRIDQCEASSLFASLYGNL